MKIRIKVIIIETVSPCVTEEAMTGTDDVTDPEKDTDQAVVTGTGHVQVVAGVGHIISVVTSLAEMTVILVDQILPEIWKISRNAESS